jgi:diguanylate cyclase (GGDEF)-like protein/PAS domain S-box-containing protein
MRTSQIILQRSLPQLFAVLAVAGLALLYAMAHMTAALDRSITEHSQFLVRKALTDTVRKAEREVAGLMVIGRLDAHAPPHADALKQDLDAFCQALTCDAVLLVAPDGKVVNAESGEDPLQLHLGDHAAEDVLQLLARARNSDPTAVPMSGLIEVNGIPAAAAAAVIAADASFPFSGHESGSVLLLVDILKADELLQLGFDYGVADLHLADGSLTPTESTIRLLRVDGSPIDVHWTTPGLGEESLDALLPVMGAAALLIAILIGLIARDAVKGARQLEKQHADLTASQAQLMASETRFRDIAEAASDWLWETDAHTTLVYLSERFEQVTQFSARRWLGRPLGELLKAETSDVVTWLHDHSQQALRCRYTDRNGAVRICRVAARPIIKDGQCLGYRGTASDITEEVKVRTEIEHLSMHDALTGLPNRSQLHTFLVRKLNQAQPLALLSLDLDRFKPVNDTLGHAAGDRVLHEISARLLECTRGEDLVARLGGDEFIMVVGGEFSPSVIERLCSRIIEQIKQPIIYEGQEIFVGTSIGIALTPQDATQADELLRCADIALYQAKADGRATWRFYAAQMNKRLVERRELELGLRQAISSGEMRVYYQPRYRTDGMQIIGAEALVRWQHPQRGLLAPAEFLPLAEETGLIIPLGQWVLAKACIEATRWPAHMVVSVNLSVVQFRQSHLLNDVQRALKHSRLAPERLELEVAESILLDESAGALKTLTALKAIGVGLTLDDFGTGYSSLNYLRNYPFDGLKIDRSFITNMLNSVSDRTIVKAIVGLAQALDITVTAEGVETKEQLDWLGEENCQEVQGVHMSKPRTAEDMAALVGSLQTFTHQP